MKTPALFLSHLITISGPCGVGTSTAVKQLCNTLGTTWNYRSAGAWMREQAAERDMSIEEFVVFNQENPHLKIDEQCDRAIWAYGRQNHSVIEGRLAHIYAPHGFHVRIDCDYSLRAQRCKDRPEYAGLEAVQIEEEFRKRDSVDSARFKERYKLGNYLSPDYFHFTIDTATNSKIQVAQRILTEHQHWIAKLAPECLIYTESL